MNTETPSTLRRDFEIFLCWFAAAHLISAFITSVGLPYFFAEMLKEGSSSNAYALVCLTSLSAHLTGIVAAVWLWNREYLSNRSRVIWTIFGLASALWAIGLYLLILLVMNQGSEKIASELSDPENK